MLSVHDYSSKNSIKGTRELNPLVRRVEKKVNKTTNVVEHERLSTNNSNMRSRERIPHSAFYMHKLHKRVSTAANEDKNGQRSKGEIVDELRSFTKKMVGRRGY